MKITALVASALTFLSATQGKDHELTARIMQGALSHSPRSRTVWPSVTQHSDVSERLRSSDLPVHGLGLQ